MDKQLTKTVLKNILPGRFDVTNFKMAFFGFVEAFRLTLFALVRPLIWLTFPISVPLAIWAAHVSKRKDEEAIRKAEAEWLGPLRK